MRWKGRCDMETIRDKVFYCVVGFKDATKMATFDKDDYVKKGNAQRAARRLIKQGFEEVMLRREEVWLRNDDNEFSASTPIEKYTSKGMEEIKQLHLCKTINGLA